MEEPKKVLRAQYLGSMQVNQATGMEVLNEAIEHIVTNTPINQWRNVNVAVAPSMISILTPNVSILKISTSEHRKIKAISIIYNDYNLLRTISLSPSVEYAICHSLVSVTM